MRYYKNIYDDLHRISREQYYSLLRAKSREQLLIYNGGHLVARLVRARRSWR